MTEVKKKRGRPKKVAPLKKVKGEIIVAQMNVRINKVTYSGDKGDSLELLDWHYDKLKNLGFIK